VVHLALADGFGIGSEYAGSTDGHCGPPQSNWECRQGIRPYFLKPL
jgi:hypothetical protein